MTGHLLHIGYAKTGANLLRQWFAAHPQLAYAERGIAGFGDVEAIARAGATHQPLPRYWVTSSEALSSPSVDAGLSSTVDYDALLLNSMPETQDRTCLLLGALFPGAYVLIVTRGFRAMSLSGYSQYVRTGGHKALATLCAEAAQVDQQPWNYDYLIGLYRQRFGETKVIVLPYELLRDDPGRFVEQIAQRLGLLPSPPPVGRPNPSLSPLELAWYPELTRRVGALPEEGGVRRRAMEEHLRALNEGRLIKEIERLQELHPRAPVTSASVTDEMLQPFRAFALGLRDDPLFRPYAPEYLLG